MADYARALSGGATHFGDKDALTTGNAAKKIVGAQFDTEFNAILTAIASKYDTDNLADQAAAEAHAATGSLLSPASLAYWSDHHAGILGDIQDTGGRRNVEDDEQGCPQRLAVIVQRFLSFILERRGGVYHRSRFRRWCRQRRRLRRLRLRRS